MAGVFEFSCFGITGRISLSKILVSHETSREQNVRIADLQGKFFSQNFLAWQTIEGKLGHRHLSYAHHQLTSHKEYPASDTPLNTP